MVPRLEANMRLENGIVEGMLDGTLDGRLDGKQVGTSKGKLEGSVEGTALGDKDGTVLNSDTHQIVVTILTGTCQKDVVTPLANKKQ